MNTKGFIFVPFNIMIELKLKPNQAFILSLIYSLEQSFKHVTISNQKIADSLNISKRAVVDNLNTLKDMELIDDIIINRTLRTLELTPKAFRLFKGVLDAKDKKRRESQKKGGFKPKKKGQAIETQVDWFENYLNDERKA